MRMVREPVIRGADNGGLTVYHLFLNSMTFGLFLPSYKHWLN